MVREQKEQTQKRRKIGSGAKQIWCLIPRALKPREAEQAAFGQEGEEAGQTASRTDKSLFT